MNLNGNMVVGLLANLMDLDSHKILSKLPLVIILSL